MPMSRTSHYLPMRDGVRIAVDVHLPDGHAGPYATILHQTRYFRGIEVRARRFKRLEPAFEMVHKTRTRFLAAGYAWVDVDARGSGASFGRRPCPWSPDEVADGGEIVDWIIRQPWSEGAVGATGVSYGGTTAEMLLLCQHPAVKAIVPRFSLYDVYTDVMAPGGVPLQWFTENWNRVNQNLDASTYEGTVSTAVRIVLQGLGDASIDPRTPRWSRFLRGLDRPFVEKVIARNIRRIGAGVRPVDDDVDALAAAVAEHAENYDVSEQARRVEYRDDLLPESVEYDHLPSWRGIVGSVGRFSPHSYVDALRGSGAAILSISGWLDGAYQHAAIKRHLTVGNPGSYLLIGPWEHGGNLQVSPFAASRKARFDQEGAMIRFFDHHLRGAPRPEWAPVRYYTMGSEIWQSAQTWPPQGLTERTLFFDRDRTLTTRRPTREGVDEVVLPSDSTSGRSSRWRSYVGPHQFIGYPDRAGQTKNLPVWTSAPLEKDLEITGHAMLTLHLHAAARDGDLFVYLEEQGPGGELRYITEGLLRLRHRRVHPDTPPYRSPAPYRTYHREDARELGDGAHEVKVDLLPVSYQVRKGSRLRVVLTGADLDNFGQPLTLGRVGVERGGSAASSLTLPVVR